MYMQNTWINLGHRIYYTGTNSTRYNGLFMGIVHVHVARGKIFKAESTEADTMYTDPLKRGTYSTCTKDVRGYYGIRARIKYMYNPCICMYQYLCR